jgi:hypothetical protein
MRLRSRRKRNGRSRDGDRMGTFGSSSGRRKRERERGAVTGRAIV